MASRQASYSTRIGTQIAARRMANLFRPIHSLDAQPVGIFLLPIERSIFAIHSQSQAISLTRRNLRCHQHSARAVVEAQQRRAIVVQRPALHNRAKCGVQLRHLKAGYVFNQVKSMSPDIADASTGSVQFRVGTPCRLLLAGGLYGMTQPALQILNGNLADSAKFAAGADSPRLP